MNRRLLTWPVVLLPLALIVALSGCKRRDDRGAGEPIKGKSSDPAVTFVGRWDETNAFVYHLETITGTQIPRRNTNGMIQQDTILAKDLRFGVTNVTPQGFRSMKMEIQAVRVETTADQRMTSAFDTENEMLSTEDNAVASRLRGVKGAQLGFRLSPANRVLRVDGTKEFTDRTGANRNVKGAAGAVLNKFFNQQFYRDLIEMAFLPTNPVRIGESWIIRTRSMAGLYNNMTVDLTYTFRGWQVHENTNCARFDFTGDTQPKRSTNTVRSTSSAEEAEIEGTVWFSPDLGVPVEMMVNQSLTRNSTSTKVVRPPGTNAGPNMVTVPMKQSRVRGTNSPPEASPPPEMTLEVEEVSDPPPPGAPGRPRGPGSANAPSPTVTSNRTTTTKQHLVFTLIEIVPVDPPASTTK